MSAQLALLPNQCTCKGGWRPVLVAGGAHVWQHVSEIDTINSSAAIHTRSQPRCRSAPLAIRSLARRPHALPRSSGSTCISTDGIQGWYGNHSSHGRDHSSYGCIAPLTLHQASVKVKWHVCLLMLLHTSLTSSGP